MSTTSRTTPELVCVLDRELPFAKRAVEALGRNMKLYIDGGQFPGWDALQYCAQEGLLPIERFQPNHDISGNLRAYPRTLAQCIHAGNINISILLNTIGGSTDYIGLFRAAVRHVLWSGRGTVHTFAVRAHSAGAHIGMLAPKNHRAITRWGQYLWHTGEYAGGPEIEEWERMTDILQIQQELLRNVQSVQRRRMHQLLLGVLADEGNKRHEIVLDGEELQDFGIVRHVAQNPEELTVLFVQRTGVRPDFWIPGSDPVARFFSHAALEERAKLEGYTLSFPRLNAMQDFSLRSFVSGEGLQRPWRDVREDLLDYAAGFPQKMWEMLRMT